MSQTPEELLKEMQLGMKHKNERSVGIDYLKWTLTELQNISHIIYVLTMETEEKLRELEGRKSLSEEL